MSAAPAITSTTQALDLLDGALAYLSAADAAQLPAVIQAQCLAALERADARATAARASILAAFTSGQGYSADADYSPRAWLGYDNKWGRELEHIFLQSEDLHHQGQLCRKWFSRSQLRNNEAGRGTVTTTVTSAFILNALQPRRGNFNSIEVRWRNKLRRPLRC